jgi:hypothetical protein
VRSDSSTRHRLTKRCNWRALRGVVGLSACGVATRAGWRVAYWATARS